ncbi:MAG: hypothetical protein OEZ22_10240, partial [Spirochaetia bacterium]|nr:hypothetical protein [Spirochaetia bacterium]
EEYVDQNDFMKKASSYVLFYNSLHKNRSKKKRTPWDIIQDRESTISRNILNFLPFRIDHYFENIPIASGGYHPINSPF